MDELYLEVKVSHLINLKLYVPNDRNYAVQREFVIDLPVKFYLEPVVALDLVHVT